MTEVEKYLNTIVCKAFGCSLSETDTKMVALLREKMLPFLSFQEGQDIALALMCKSIYYHGRVDAFSTSIQNIYKLTCNNQ